MGVSDDGEPLGLEYDFELHETRNVDKWELCLRSSGPRISVCYCFLPGLSAPLMNS